jgi:nitrogen fixation NifU-like protein
MSALDSMYQQLILEHAKARTGAGLPAEAAASVPDEPGVGQSHQLNPVCGDEITLRLELAGTGTAATVKEISWAGDGCAISMASASILSELSEGMAPAEFLAAISVFRELMRSRGKLEADEDVLGDAAALAGVAKYPARVKCAMLAWVAAEDALQQAMAGAAG